MPTTSRTVTVDKPLLTVADYLSEFTTSAQWDPHTASCARLDDGPLAVGARYENVQDVAGHASSLEYEVIEYEPGRGIVLEGGNDTVHTRDEMTFEDEGDGRTTVTYTVTYTFSGTAKLATPFAPVMMKKIADDAAESLREHLEQL